MSAVPLLSQFVALWARLYNDSKLVYTTVTFAHIGGIMLGGGCAIAADRMTLRLQTADVIAHQDHLEEIHAVLGPVLIGLAITFLSGLLQLAADLKTFFGSPVFWIKMGLVLVLLLNGALLQRTETALRTGRVPPDRGWRIMRGTAWVSLGLWFGTALLGAALLAV
jgi:hypothetical protein